MAIAPTPLGFQQDSEGLYIIKDPQAVKDYTINWADWLNGDIITEIDWTVDPALTVVNEGNTGTTTFIEISGGTPGKAHVCTCHVKTNNNREDDQSFRVVIREQ